MALKPPKMEPQMRTEGQRLLCAQKASLAQVVLAAGCSSKQSAANWRAGTKVPDVTCRERLEKAYGIPVAAWERAPGAASKPKAAPPVAPQVEGPKSPSPSSRTTASDLDELIGQLREQLAQEDLVSSERAKFTSSLTQALALRHRIDKEHELLEDRVIREHPMWKRVQAALLRALQPHPDAARAVVDALADIGFASTQVGQ